MRFAVLVIVLAWQAAGAQQVSIAAAADLAIAFPAVGRAFEAATKIHPVFSFGSTAQMARQIENGAPFDVFAAADAESVEHLIGANFIPAKTRVNYATGVLALWFPSGGTGLSELTSARVRVIAIANPELAPYGKASVESLRSLGIWRGVKEKIVNAGNVGMAKQYGTSGNADAVLTALSLVQHEGGTVIPVDSSLHKPITQVAGAVTKSGNQQAATAFLRFLRSQQGRSILMEHGYRAPSE